MAVSPQMSFEVILQIFGVQLTPSIIILSVRSCFFMLALLWIIKNATFFFQKVWARGTHLNTHIKIHSGIDSKNKRRKVLQSSLRGLLLSKQENSLLPQCSPVLLNTHPVSHHCILSAAIPPPTHILTLWAEAAVPIMAVHAAAVQGS